MKKYSDFLMSWLKDEGYTHCFFVAGGGSMHLLDSASKFFECVPFVHEHSAAIAAEYFSESGSSKAFCLVTTGPGLTNTITAISGAWLESHELLLIAGQVKVADLGEGKIRQRGIQELPGVEIVEPITKAAKRLDHQISNEDFVSLVRTSWADRKGPVVIEVCIDVSASEFVEIESPKEFANVPDTKFLTPHEREVLEDLLSKSKRPLILIGGGVSRAKALELQFYCEKNQIPLATTWPGADRVSSDYKYYAGRPNTFGMRWANIFSQQSDLLIAIGSRLGLQQTGFNWKNFCPVGKVVQIDIDQAETNKKHPEIYLPINMDSEIFINELISISVKFNEFTEWIDHLSKIRNHFSVIEECHEVNEPFVDPYKFIKYIEKHTISNDVFAPGTSGGTHTAFYQTFFNKPGQLITSNKGLASMGYGLAGAIGAAFAHPNSRVISFEGDGSFSQNLQELATVVQNNLNIKIFIVSNSGYASIRSSQKAYFSENYLGCDTETGLGFPDWKQISKAFGLEYFEINSSNYENLDLIELFENRRPVIFELLADPNQMYLPKISSRLLPDGSMVSNSLQNMDPKISEAEANEYLKYLPQNLWFA